jgi:two-component system, chemotaxis family, protein-glutamate methylesterase/glutaminase
LIRVFVVEDSPVVREFISHILCTDPAIEIVATAENGQEALDLLERIKPDVITMDIQMPRLNGFDACRRIMETRPIPIVIVSGTVDVTETVNAFRAMDAGALAILPRPAGLGHADHERTAADLVRTVKLMSEVKVVRRWPRPQSNGLIPPVSGHSQVCPPVANNSVVAIGASTGGPPILKAILSGLAHDFPVAVLIVQHIARGFTGGLVEWLQQSSNLPVHAGREQELILPGNVYVAPDGFHMKVTIGGRIELSQEEPENGLRPSVSTLFRSVANVYSHNAIGVLLTGMGRDGARELKLMRDRGAVTIAQDRESSIVHGMAGEAIKLGAAVHILPPEKIVALLASLVARKEAARSC